MQTGNEYRNSKIALVQENMYHFMIHKRKQTQPQESNIIYIYIKFPLIFTSP